MNISKEFLLEAVGLSLVVALILISMQIFQRAVKITNLLEKEQEQQIIELEEYEIVKYDGLQIDGMTAVSYIKKMVAVYEIPVKVINTEIEFLISSQDEITELRDTRSNRYINPLTKYYCEVVRNENEVIKEIIVKVVKGEEKI